MFCDILILSENSRSLPLHMRQLKELALKTIELEGTGEPIIRLRNKSFNTRKAWEILFLGPPAFSLSSHHSPNLFKIKDQFLKLAHMERQRPALSLPKYRISFVQELRIENSPCLNSLHRQLLEPHSRLLPNSTSSCFPSLR